MTFIYTGETRVNNEGITERKIQNTSNDIFQDEYEWLPDTSYGSSSSSDKYENNSYDDDKRSADSWSCWDQ